MKTIHMLKQEHQQTLPLDHATTENPYSYNYAFYLLTPEEGNAYAKFYRAIQKGNLPEQGIVHSQL